MAVTITSQTMADGERSSVVKIMIVSDGVGGELNNQLIYDASAFSFPTNSNRLDKVACQLNGFDCVLSWDATTPVPFMALDQNMSTPQDLRDAGGIVNNGGAGQTGDILISTGGLSNNATYGTIILYITKRKPI